MSGINLYSGKLFNFEKYTSKDIDINDIASALAKLCRFNGHINHFYSVAEHSCHISDYFKKLNDTENAKFALLHDATEAYIGDMPSPLKWSDERFRILENDLWIKAIAPKFNLPYHSEKVKIADKRILITEVMKLNPRFDIRGWPYEKEPLDVRIKKWNYKEAYWEFMERYKSLFLVPDSFT